MARSVLAWLAIAAGSVAGTVLGTAAAALRTDAGRHLVVDAAVKIANRQLRGTLTVGEVGGSFLRGLEVESVAVKGEDGVELMMVERVGLRYRVQDLWSGRIVFGQLTLTGPRMNLVQWRPGGRLNLDEILSGDEGGGGGPSPLIAFRDVQITDGSLVVRTPVDASSTTVPERDKGPHGYLRVRRIDGINAEFTYLRLSSPRPDEDAILGEIGHLHAEMSDPAIKVEELQGRVELQADSIVLGLPLVRLPTSELRLAGSLAWRSDTLMVDLRVRAEHVTTDEVRGLVPDVPAGLAGSGDFTVHSVSGDMMEVVGEELDLEGVGGGGRARGRLSLVLGPGDGWANRGTTLRLNDFDLEYVRSFLDTLPVAGRVTGRVTADGRRELLRLDLDVVFRDSLVPGWPASSIRGEGLVALGVPGDFVFRSFAVEEASIRLASVRRLVPAVVLQGRIRGSGTLEGPWLNAGFEGELGYADVPLPETVARGVVRLDASGDTVGVWADVGLDSLHMQSFRSTFPGLGLVGDLAGRVVLAGRLDSLVVDADLEGPGGAIRGHSALVLLADRRGLHELEFQVRQFDFESFRPSLPQTRISGQVAGAVADGEDGTTGLRVRLALDGSSVQGVSLDSVRGIVAVGDTVLRIDTLGAWGEALRAEVRGAIGLHNPASDTLSFTARIDSIGVLEPLLGSWIGAVDTTGAPPPPSGSLRLAGWIAGALEAFHGIAVVQADAVRRGDLFLSSAGGTVTWVSRSRALRLEAMADSLEVGGVALGRVEARLDGRPDSLHWHGRSRLGPGAWIAGGQWIAAGGSSRMPIDSLGLRLATGAWFVDTGAVVIVDDSGLTFSDLAFAHDRGPGRVSLAGRLPFAGPGGLTGSIEALPVKDLWLLLLKDSENADGELSGTFGVSGTARTPIVELWVALRDGVFGAFRAPYTEAVIEYRDQRLAGDVELWRLGERVLNIEVGLPLDLALIGARRRRLPGPVRVRAIADGVDLSLLEATTPMVRDMSGTLDADFGIAGTWERPELTGHVAVRDGSVTFPALGVRHEGLNGTLSLSGDTISVQELSLTSGGGTAAIEGFVRLEELSRPILNLSIDAREFRTIDVRDFLSLTATADVQVQGPFYGATLTGRGTASQGVLYFADLVRKEIVNLEDTLLAAFVDTSLLRRQGLGAELESRFLDSLRIDSLQVGMGSDVWLRSGEANIQLTGEVFVSKIRDRYRFDGTLEAPRGTYRLQLGLGNTREFTVTQGEVRYFGTSDLNADVDIDARHVVRAVRGEDVTVFVHIGGSLYEPTLTLSSDMRPAISETEIISYLLVGAPSFQAGIGASGFETRILSQQLLGPLSSQLEYSLISDLGVPLDYLQIRPAATTGVLSGLEIAVGKQFRVLGTTAFLTASPRICPREQFVSPEVGASLEFRLSRQWLIAASVDPLRSCETLTTPLAASYQFGLDLFWEKSY